MLHNYHCMFHLPFTIFYFYSVKTHAVCIKLPREKIIIGFVDANNVPVVACCKRDFSFKGDTFY